MSNLTTAQVGPSVDVASPFGIHGGTAQWEIDLTFFYNVNQTTELVFSSEKDFLSKKLTF